MKKKKKQYIITTLLIILLFCCTISITNYKTTVTYGDTTYEYARIVEDDIYFYSNETLSPDDVLFSLPKSYYIKIISTGDLYYECAYADTANGYSKILGFVNKKDVEICDGISPLYPNVSLSTISQSNIYSQPSTASKIIISLFAGQNVEFYGFATDKNFLFVQAGDDFGYINIKNVETPSISEHPLPLPETTPAPTPTPTDSPVITEPISNNIPTTVQILLVIFIVIPVVIISIFLFSKRLN